jgi:hypothetical protein
MEESIRYMTEILYWHLPWIYENEENLFDQDSVTAEFRTRHLQSQVLRLKSVLSVNKVNSV